MLEKRFNKAAGLEVREASDGAPLISGVGIVYNRMSQDMGGWFETISPTSVNKTLGDGASRVYASFNHDPNYILGRVSAGTLQLRNTPNGLLYDIAPPLSSPFGQHVLESVRRGDVNGSSFTFRNVTPASWAVDESGRSVRTVSEMQLFELGPVVSPAYLDTEATSRSMVIAELSKQKALDAREVELCLSEGNLRDIILHEVRDADQGMACGGCGEGLGSEPAGECNKCASPYCGNCGSTGRCGSCGAFTPGAAADASEDDMSAERSGTVISEDAVEPGNHSRSLVIARMRLSLIEHAPSSAGR